MTDFSLETWQWLTSPEAAAFLDEPSGAGAEKMDAYRHTLFLREKCGLTLQQAAAVVMTCALRTRALRKFPAAGRMFFTPVGLEQSTDAFIAAYKASRFPAGACVADLCCGVGGDLCALAARGPVLGVEKNPAVAHLAAVNLAAVTLAAQTPADSENSGHRSRVLCEDVADFAKKYPPEIVPCVHVDPDRRPAGVRTTRMEFFAPTQETLTEILVGRLLSAIKLSPASDPLDVWRERGEMEWISRDGECRQLIAWLPDASFFGNHEAPPFKIGHHRATIIAPHAPDVLRTLTGAPRLRVPVSETPERFIFDVDSAVLAANLEGELAREHGLNAVASGAAYLTGNHAVTTDPALHCFRILEILPLDKKRLNAAVRARAWQTVEIKKRGDVPTPETVRKWLKLPPGGTSSGVIFLFRTPTGAVAVLAERRN